MKMQINENAIQKLREKVAARLLQAGHMLATALKAQLSTSYPPASRPGEFPHYRTGAGRDAVAVSPDSPQAIMANNMTVRIGYRKMATFDYMPFLETQRRRHGLLFQYQQMKPILQKIIRG